LDPTRQLAQVRFDGATARLIGYSAPGDDIFSGPLDVTRHMLAA
jgi:hypothetical protein